MDKYQFHYRKLLDFQGMLRDTHIIQVTNHAAQRGYERLGVKLTLPIIQEAVDIAFGAEFRKQYKLGKESRAVDVYTWIDRKPAGLIFILNENDNCFYLITATYGPSHTMRLSLSDWPELDLSARQQQ